MLFAEDPSDWGANAVSVLVGGVLFGLGMLAVRLYRAWGGYAKDVAEARATSAETDQKRESAAVKELRALLTAYKQDHEDNRTIIHDQRDQMNVLTQRLSVCEVGCARRDERIAALEEALDEAGIPHRKWDPDAPPSGSTIHRSQRAPRPKPPETEGAGE